MGIEWYIHVKGLEFPLVHSKDPINTSYFLSAFFPWLALVWAPNTLSVSLTWEEQLVFPIIQSICCFTTHSSTQAIPFFLEWWFSFLLQLTLLAPENFQGLPHFHPWSCLSLTAMRLRGASFLLTVFSTLFCNFHFAYLIQVCVILCRRWHYLIWSYILNVEGHDYLRIHTHKMLVE